MSSESQGQEDLDGVKGKIFKVNLKKKSFEILKETVFDPKTNEGKSRHEVFWSETTKFKILTDAMGEVRAVLDIDSVVSGVFDNIDEEYLSNICNMVSERYIIH